MTICDNITNIPAAEDNLNMEECEDEMEQLTLDLEDLFGDDSMPDITVTDMVDEDIDYFDEDTTDNNVSFEWEEKCYIQYVHHFGEVTHNVDAFTSNYTFAMLCDNRRFIVKTDSSTLLQLSNCRAGDKIHVIGDVMIDSIKARVICSEDFYDLFVLFESIQTKAENMMRFYSLPEDMKKSIVMQRLNSKCDIADDSYCFTGKVSDMDDMKLKYEMCKDTYTIAQQREIDALIASNPRLREKSKIKLKYILNISPSYHEHTDISYSDLMRKLDEKLYGMDAAKTKIVECLISCKYAKKRGCRILLVGSPGTGKTTIARLIAESYGLPFERIDMSTAISAIDIKGLVSSYDGADAGKLVKSFYSAGTSEMVLLLEEIDKMGTSDKDGNPADALLDTLSDEYCCYDAFLGMAVDTSNTIYIATANSTTEIPAHLLDRFDVIHVDDYSVDDKVEIARNYIIPRIRDTYGIAGGEIVFRRDALEFITRNYCSDFGVRMLKENLLTIVRSILNSWERNGRRNRVTVTAKSASAVLEPFFTKPDAALRFARNRERFSPAVQEEIRRTLISISSGSSDAMKRETDIRRVEYLTSLIPGAGEFTGFDSDYFFSVVNESHFGMKDLKNRIARLFNSKAVMQKSLSGDNILLVGGAGVGKTSICQMIAKGLGIPYVKVSLNGISDERVLKGISPFYTGADAGAIVRGLSRAGTIRALVQLDELDKLGLSHGIKVSNVLFDLLDDSSSFTDSFLGVPIDLSDALFVATANDISNLEPWLLDRFTVINIDGYTDPDKREIIRDYLIPEFEKQYAKSGITIEMSQEAMKALTEDYCTSFGVRDIKKSLKVIVEDYLLNHPNNNKIVISDTDVVNSLGFKPIPRGNLPEKRVSGFAAGLAVTGNSGMAFAIETTIIPESNATCITGLPKECAIDSVKLAKTFIRMNYQNDHSDFGLHLHFGEGAVVKDGPSAGVAITVSILSALYNVPVAEFAAYTGEIDLFGNVFAVGGVMQKIQAAAQVGCTKVFIPAANYKRLTSEEKSKFNIEIIPVSNVTDVVSIVLPDIESNCLSLL